MAIASLLSISLLFSLSSLVLPYPHLSVCLPPFLLRGLGLGAEAGEALGPKEVASAAGQAGVQCVPGKEKATLSPASLLARGLGSSA